MSLPVSKIVLIALVIAAALGSGTALLGDVAMANHRCSPAPATCDAYWNDSLMGTLRLDKDTYAISEVITLTAMTAETPSRRWLLTDSGYVASGMYQVSVHSGIAATLVDYGPKAGSTLAVSASNSAVTWSGIELSSTPPASCGWLGCSPNPDIDSYPLPTSRFPAGSVFWAKWRVDSGIPDTTHSVTGAFTGNVGYIHWTDPGTATYFSITSGGNVDVTLAASPIKLAPDEYIAVVMNVANNTRNAIGTVTPANLSIEGDGNAVFALVDPDPPVVQRLGAGQSATFTFRYRATKPGLVIFFGLAQWTDASGVRVTSSRVRSNAVRIRKEMILNVEVDPFSINLNPARIDREPCLLLAY